MIASRRSHGFIVGDRVKGLSDSISTSTGVVTKFLPGSRVEVRWDAGPSTGVTENRSVDQLVAHIAPPPVPVVNRNDTDRRCGLPGCNLAVFTWDQNINLLGSRERGVYLCSEHANFFQKDVNKFVQSHLRNQEIAEEDNLLDEMSDPDGIV